MSELRILTLAHEKISRQTETRMPGNARDTAGNKISPFSPDAVEFCGYGALLSAGHEVLGDEKRATEVADRLARQFSPFGPLDLVQISFQGGRDEVLSVYDQLISRR